MATPSNWNVGSEGAGASVQLGGMRLTNPIPSIIQDGVNSQLWKKHKIVPYATDSVGTAHNLLHFLFQIYELSHSAKIGMNKLMTLAFSGLDIQTKSRKGFVANRPEMSESDKTGFADWLESIGLDGKVILSITRSLTLHEKICGFRVLRITVAKSGDVRKVKIQVVDPRNYVRYCNFEDASDPINGRAMVSNMPIKSDSILSNEQGKKKAQTFEDLPIYPEVKTDKARNVIDTLFVQQAEGYEDNLYGRSAFNPFWLYVDYEIANLLGKLSRHELTAKLLALVKDDFGFGEEGAGGKKEFAASVRQTTTNAGEGNSIGLIYYPDVAPEIVKVDVMRDTNFLDFMKSSAAESITSSLGIDKRICGIGSFGGTLGGNIYRDTLIGVSETTIVPEQNRNVEFWDDVFAFLFKELEESRFINHSLKFENRTDSMIAKLNQSKNEPTSTEPIEQQ